MFPLPLQGYSSGGVLALSSSVRAVGSRLLGAPGAMVGVQVGGSSEGHGGRA